MKTILFLIDSLDGYGAERSIVQIASHLKTVKPIFVHLKSGNTLKPILENKGIHVYSLSFDKEITFNDAVKSLVRIVEKESPAIIHSMLFRADMVARRIKAIYPEIILVGSLVSNSYGLNRYRKLTPLSKVKLFSTQIRDRISTNKVDYFVCNSNAIKKVNLKALGIPLDRVEVIYRGRSFSGFNSSMDKILSIKNNFDLHDKLVFLNVSRLSNGKGQIDLLRAFKNISTNIKNARLLIAGEGNNRNSLENKIKQLNLNSKVSLLGYRDDVVDLLASANYFVFPSYYEGLPGALIEASIAGLPVIASDIPENIECFPNESALFFKSGDVNDLTEKMKLALQLDDWDRRTADAYKYAHNNFNISTISEKYEKFYIKIIEDSV